MRHASHVMATIAIGIFATAASAQTRPDFSGQWISTPDSSATESRGNAPADAARGERAGGARGARGAPTGDMGSGWGQTITITQDAKQLTVEYAFFTRGDMQPPLRFVYALDGSETKASVMMGRGIQTQTSRTTWNGNRLVITTLHTFPHPDTGQALTSEVTRSLSLESPTTLVVETARSGVLGGPPSTTRTVYRKL